MNGGAHDIATPIAQEKRTSLICVNPTQVRGPLGHHVACCSNQSLCMMLPNRKWETLNYVCTFAPTRQPASDDAQKSFPELCKPRVYEPVEELGENCQGPNCTNELYRRKLDLTIYTQLLLRLIASQVISFVGAWCWGMFCTISDRMGHGEEVWLIRLHWNPCFAGEREACRKSSRYSLFYFFGPTLSCR